MRHQVQRGGAVLPVALILLAGAALMLLFAQRNLLVDWRITQNGYGHRLAYSAAESGLAAVVSALNDSSQRAQILADTKGMGRYDTVRKPIHELSIGDMLSTRVDIKALGLGQADLRLQLQSTGCVHSCELGKSQGRAVVSQTLAMLGGIHRIPYALMTARGAITATGSPTLNNQVSAVRGMLLHAGRDITVDDTVIRQSVPGNPPDATSVAPDKALSQMLPDQFFQYWLGGDKAFVRNTATPITCSGECGMALAAAGSRVIWIAGDARISSGVIGSAAEPVVLLASGTLEITGSARITGIVYSMGPTTRLALTQGRLEGAVIAENDLLIESTGIYNYHATALQAAQTHLGRFVPVPGRWSDGE
jgi:hypothetical protein